ncbi:MAG: hypothetical protein LUC44_06665 [Prevotellaceae bacterium]|nr:hypothetical protein [Prevotellaceae bacterium]
MSDGNFNRSLLPHTPYQSGVTMGKSIARQKALEAFRVYLSETQPLLSEEEISRHTARFTALLAL